MQPAHRFQTKMAVVFCLTFFPALAPSDGQLVAQEGTELKSLTVRPEDDLAAKKLAEELELDSPEPDPQIREFLEKLRTIHQERAASLKFFTADNSPLELRSEPLLWWRSRQDGFWAGDVFLWTHKGRPQIVGCIGSWTIDDKTRGVFEELQSLSDQPLGKTKLDQTSSWQSRVGGVEFNEIEDAPAPETDSVKRLEQMQTLKQQFEAFMSINGSEETLRVLSQPIYRYQCDFENSATDEPLDGALSAFVTASGTDPEVLLMIECRRVKKELRWFYAPARFTHRDLWVTLGEEEVWRVASHQTPRKRPLITDPYLSLPTEPVSVDGLPDGGK